MIVTVIILLEQIYRVSESLLDISEFEYFSIPVYTSRNSQLVCDIRIHSLSLFSKWIKHSFKLCSLHYLTLSNHSWDVDAINSPHRPISRHCKSSVCRFTRYSNSIPKSRVRSGECDSDALIRLSSYRTIAVIVTLGACSPSVSRQHISLQTLRLNLHKCNGSWSWEWTALPGYWPIAQNRERESRGRSLSRHLSHYRKYVIFWFWGKGGGDGSLCPREPVRAASTLDLHLVGAFHYTSCVVQLSETAEEGSADTLSHHTTPSVIKSPFPLNILEE
jgi:hypothetical protein